MKASQEQDLRVLANPEVLLYHAERGMWSFEIAFPIRRPFSYRFSFPS
jgi:hypothetical protein